MIRLSIAFLIVASILIAGCGSSTTHAKPHTLAYCEAEGPKHGYTVQWCRENFALGDKLRAISESWNKEVNKINREKAELEQHEATTPAPTSSPSPATTEATEAEKHPGMAEACAYAVQRWREAQAKAVAEHKSTEGIPSPPATCQG